MFACKADYSCLYGRSESNQRTRKDSCRHAGGYRIPESRVTACIKTACNKTEKSQVPSRDISETRNKASGSTEVMRDENQVKNGISITIF